MPLNPLPKHPKHRTFQYDADGARDWEGFLKHSVRKLNYQGKVNPKGGLVQLFYNTDYDSAVISIQFIDRPEGDPREFPYMSPKVYDGESWVRVSDYVDKKTCDWCRGRPYLMDRVGGEFKDLDNDARHTGKFPYISDLISNGSL